MQTLHKSLVKMPTGKGDKKGGESSGEDTKKRTASPDENNDQNDGSDSQDSRRSRRKRQRVSSPVFQIPCFGSSSVLLISLTCRAVLMAKRTFLPHIYSSATCCIIFTFRMRIRPCN